MDKELIEAGTTVGALLSTFAGSEVAFCYADMVLVRDARLLFVELKTERGRLTLPQRSWLVPWSSLPPFSAGAAITLTTVGARSPASPAALRQCRAAEVYEWRPSDWLKIEAVLR